MNIPRNNDISAIQIQTRDRQLNIFNNRDMLLWGGDFNQHHPLWDNDEEECLFTLQAMREADVLISKLDHSAGSLAGSKRMLNLARRI